MRLSAESARHILDEHRSRSLKPKDFGKAIEVLSKGQVTKRNDPRAPVFLAPVDGTLWRAVVKILGEEAYLVSFHPKGRISK